MPNIVVSGAAGRMGKRIVALSREYKEIKLVGALERQDHKDIGRDIGEVAGIGPIGIRLAGDLDDLRESPDVLIEFSTPQASLEHLRIASDKGIAMVIGTTGLSRDETEEVLSHARKIPCVLAPNMSIGINLLLRIVQDVARILGEDYDIEIIEAHHRMKKDAPSGTALKIAQTVAETLGRDLDSVGVYSRKGLIGERSKTEIGIQTIRAGDIIGEHTILFGGLGERIEITHRASSRDTFARGALKAAVWVSAQEPGLYDMQDVLGLK